MTENSISKKRLEPTAREAQIVQARDQGITWRVIAAQHGISKSRAMELYNRRKRVEQEFQKYRGTPRGELSKRAYYVVHNLLGLKMNEDWTKEQLRAIPRETLADHPNCGKKTMVEIDEYLSRP